MKGGGLILPHSCSTSNAMPLIGLDVARLGYFGPVGNFACNEFFESAGRVADNIAVLRFDSLTHFSQFKHLCGFNAQAIQYRPRHLCRRHQPEP